LIFALSKLFWILAAPGNLLVLLLTIGTLRLMTSRRRQGLGLVTVATIGLLTITVLPVGAWPLVLLENRFSTPANLPARIDGIVVLGGGAAAEPSEVGGELRLGRAAARLTAAVRLAQRFPEARVVVAGGSWSVITAEPPEAHAMRQYLIERGIDPERITSEARSRNTYENAIFAREEAKPRPGEIWLLVTSAAHMPRAVGCFRAAGWPVISYPVDYRIPGYLSASSDLSLSEQLTLVESAAKEWVGLIAYYVMGRTDALFPAPG
jgi:uncharacterized SAM-binding protein YcdF (DUF218 family)